MFWQLKLLNKKGLSAENRALEYLEARGMKLLNRNYACKAGEIDLVMLEKETLVFVEVRFRSQSQFGSAAESITPRKQNKIRKAANHFLALHSKHQHRLCRFDALLLRNASIHDDVNSEKPIEWIKGIF
ncbi:YraN family protein [Endozoicomonas sp. 8E]|uniref:YraN family protein n=1 Tax=Endozoicomonas sp. 8E TaxID=3035692 RepID=UPI0029392678|nr:YraN family protein [Endozoicomonas sp. 8E]WOG26186.1 YraN family protein [Endozoicomonas sp. 8E]